MLIPELPFALNSDSTKHHYYHYRHIKTSTDDILTLTLTHPHYYSPSLLSLPRPLAPGMGMTITVSDPPSYDSISPTITDKLPPYSNSIHIATLCRRKLEYTAPNVPARKGTRGWHFYWLVLYGTALTIYQPTRKEVDAHLKHETVTRAARLKEHKRAIQARKISKIINSSTSERPPNVLYPHPNGVESASPRPRTTTTPPQSSSPSPSPMHKHSLESLDGPLTTSAPEPLPIPPPPPLVIGGKPHPGAQTRPDVRTHKLVRQYTMNGATCVRAYDYLRRYFVLRIRADGQQFMVQLNSYPETVEWLAVSNSLFPFLFFFGFVIDRADRG